MPSNIDTCLEALDKVQQVDALDQPCRTVVIVYSAWGIIQNGGFAYFFENNFPGDPPFEVFTQAFRQVGLDAIALRFKPRRNVSVQRSTSVHPEKTRISQLATKWVYGCDDRAGKSHLQA